MRQAARQEAQAIRESFLLERDRNGADPSPYRIRHIPYSFDPNEAD